METLSPYQKRFIAKGKLAGQQETLVELLEARFGQVPDVIVEAVNQITRPRLLTKLVRDATQVSTLEEFRSLLSS
jgi:hypothetical protein